MVIQLKRYMISLYKERLWPVVFLIDFVEKIMAMLHKMYGRVFCALNKHLVEIFQRRLPLDSSRIPKTLAC